VNLPDKPQIDSATRQQRTSATGKLEWTAAAKWESETVKDRFNKAW
jgi:hypothetical protein